MAKNTYRIKISDGKNNGYIDFSIKSDRTLNPTQGNVGTELTVSGSGFQANSNLTIKYDDTKVATAKVNANGSFEASFNAPVSKHGEHLVTLSDGTTVSEMTFTMESEPPPVPRLLLPANNAKVAETPDFKKEVRIMQSIYRNFTHIFPLVQMFTACIPSYSIGMWCFVFCSKKYDPLHDFQVSNYRKYNLKNRYYNAAIHKASFSLPNFLLSAL